ARPARPAPVRQYGAPRTGVDSDETPQAVAVDDASQRDQSDYRFESPAPRSSSGFALLLAKPARVRDKSVSEPLREP
ncbi:MAG: hypothetical protein ABI899_03755, partial [Actinomycetota bacterium]